MDARSSKVLAQIAQIASHPASTPKDVADAVHSAYEIGLAEGRLEGATSVGESLRKAFSKEASPS